MTRTADRALWGGTHPDTTVLVLGGFGAVGVVAAGECIGVMPRASKSLR